MFSRVYNKVYTHFTSVTKEEVIFYGMLTSTVAATSSLYDSFKNKKDFTTTYTNVVSTSVGGFIVGMTIPFTFPLMCGGLVVGGINHFRNSRSEPQRGI